MHDGRFEQPVGRSENFGLTSEAAQTLHTRIVWVTGAGTGFGRAVAIALALCGATVIVTGRRSDKLRDAIDEAVAHGVQRKQLTALPLDLTSADECSLAAVFLRDAGANGFVHCAAIPQPPRRGALLEADDFPTLWKVNVESAWRCARAFVPAAAANGVVRAVFYSSEAAWHFTPGFGPYNVSKAALNSLAGSLAEEAAALYPEADVQINVLNPGEARTEMNQGSTVSPYSAVPMTLGLLAHGNGGPNGYFFHADSRALPFGARRPWGQALSSLRA